MRGVMAAGITGFLLGVAVWLDTLRPGGPLLNGQVEQLLPVPFAVVSLGVVLYTINDRKWGRVPWSKVKPVLRALPFAVWAVMLPLFAATLINLAVSYRSGLADQSVMARGVIGNLAWVCAGAAALGYGVLRQRRAAEVP
ncbi:hypothetical protein HDA40_002282 [Hamadaea flava]|uniref:Uncharacterized protein n=1 Tax=Hamadaea flava TaxID=1742688 RepID=A0ABV8LK13_9ACTN|nr:hypothetical protein [Hamadaea flava]MCP2323775.1 hypothetical protein [Hamadaea flava]